MKRSIEGSLSGRGFMKAILFILILCSLGLISQAALACTCVTVGTQSPEPNLAKIREAQRRFYLEQFHGALFTGKVLHSDVIWDAKEQTNVRKVIVDVEKFWLGIDSPEVTVFTWPGNGVDCGYNFQVGKEYFFKPQIIEGVLKIGGCAYSNDLEMDPEKSAAKLEEILGKPKTFPKPKN
jgi:hypothetical protein